MSEDGEQDVKAQLDSLKTRHQALHEEIEDLEAHGGDPLHLKRLKKEKLQLKDQITGIEDDMRPDIIA